MRSGSVCAVVVTYNRKQLLRRCLDALEPQMGPQDAILIVDNASTDGTGDMLDADYPTHSTLKLITNSGGAGGFEAGMKWAYEHGYDWLWLMDDDGVPEPDCLQELIERGTPDQVLVPAQKDSGGRYYGFATWARRNIDVTTQVLDGTLPTTGPYLFTFVGALVHRTIVARVGFPRADFFIWFDDAEYSLRILAEPQCTVRVVPTAIFHHDMGQNARPVRFLGIKSVRSDVAAWKIYYGVRNQLFTLLHSRKNAIEVALFSAVNIRLLLMDIVYGPERLVRIKYRLLGALHGTFGRLGKRI